MCSHVCVCVCVCVFVHAVCAACGWCCCAQLVPPTWTLDREILEFLVFGRPRRLVEHLNNNSTAVFTRGSFSTGYNDLQCPGEPRNRLRIRRTAVNVNELRLGFSNTTRNPEGLLSHNNIRS